jgi:hypothetical protein
MKGPMPPGGPLGPADRQGTPAERLAHACHQALARTGVNRGKGGAGARSFQLT